jgi:hypothetical protein
VERGVLEPARLHETHVSVVVELGDRVYKLKKRVRMDFLDFRTREAREAVCHREVELNRRLASDVYLGVADVHGPDGRVCDHLVVMRRLPADRRLARLVEDGADVDDQLRAVARTVATFHAAGRRSPEIARAGAIDRVRRNWEDGFETLDPFGGTTLDTHVLRRASALVAEYLDGRKPLFGDRVNRGEIVDGHGDLRCEDIFCLDDGPRILDCIEFDDELRYVDVVSDVAFLAMDLEQLGGPEPASRFLGWYRELSGEACPRSLVDHYVAYRAQIRSKVECIRAAQGDPKAAERARALLALTREHLERSRVPLVLVGGLPGTGKTTVARGLADRLGWSVLRSDEIRKDLLGVAHTTRLAGDFGEGAYDDATTATVYGEMLRRASRLLSMGEPVVLDASWTDRRRRDEAAEVAAGATSPLVAVRCEAPPTITHARLIERAAGELDASDASPAIAGAMAARADPWPSSIRIDTRLDPEGAVTAACRTVTTRLRAEPAVR